MRSQPDIPATAPTAAVPMATALSCEGSCEAAASDAATAGCPPPKALRSEVASASERVRLPPRPGV
eukprot:CAMPEP_0175554934 /NCGR_PEP_ID=MMETSP0096-20121207/34109_1 /TAXON_ID=311494 /ORGANISM="Alexandrium monilatum, Strain CCMP3105" /LENGTH=65 /DNA_ID=CAMNT_0016858055 /DNA_START=244 /DNA_END=441 /DNA_ORIENTATION=+